MKITVTYCILVMSLGKKKKGKGRRGRHCGWMGHDLYCGGEEERVGRNARNAVIPLIPVSSLSL